MSLLAKLFKPDLILDRLEDLDLLEFKKQGYQAILLDLDNTLAPYYVKKIDEKTQKLIEKFEKAGFKVLIFSK